MADYIKTSLFLFVLSLELASCNSDSGHWEGDIFVPYEDKPLTGLSSQQYEEAYGDKIQTDIELNYQLDKISKAQDSDVRPEGVSEGLWNRFKDQQAVEKASHVPDKLIRDLKDIDKAIAENRSKFEATDDEVYRMYVKHLENSKQTNIPALDMEEFKKVHAKSVEEVKAMLERY